MCRNNISYILDEDIDEDVLSGSRQSDLSRDQADLLNRFRATAPTPGTNG
jgi:hypothetical protein